MISVELRGRLMLGTSAIAIALTAFSGPVSAQNVSGANANAINFLAPFLSLNWTAAGQATLAANIDQASAINQNASPAALLNANYTTAVLAALAINDENSLGTAYNNVFGIATTTSVGVAANIAGGLPNQNTTSYNTLYNGQQLQYNGQPVGAFGAVLGAAYMTGVYPGTSSSNPQPLLTNTVGLLTNAFNFTGNSLATGDSQVAKFYFANGTWNGTATAVAPIGYTLPTFTLPSLNAALPNTTNSVYDIGYGVTNTQSGQNQYGDSHPYQTLPVNDLPFTFYDPTVKTTATGGVNPDKPSSNPAFPSSHMAYAFTDGVLLGMLVPEFYQSTLLRASEIGQSRIVIGVHYPMDIIGSRSYIGYDLAQYLSNPTYINNAAVTGTAVNLPSLFPPAQSEIQTYLTQAASSAGCGTSLATCATSSANYDPYAPSSANAQVYEARLTYGLPTLTFSQAPREQAPDGPDASVLLATTYGGSTSAAQTLAPSGGIYGNLSTDTIDQVIVNTQTNALAAFYGTTWSYWSRINLYGAAGYFSGVTGTLTFASGDQLNENVTIAGPTTNVNGDVVPAGVLGGVGTITGDVLAQAGGTFAPGTPGEPGTFMTVTGNLALQSGATYMVEVNSTTSTFANVTGTAALGGNVVVAFSPDTTPLHQYTILQTGGLNGTTFAGISLSNKPNYVPSLSYTADNVLLNLTNLAATHDFNGDGKSDIVWADAAGDIALWMINGTQISQAGGLGNVGNTWSIIGQRDFNGDGKADLLWRDNAGDVAMWFMNGLAVSSTAYLGYVPPTWSVHGTGDLNGDGKGDILWQDSASGTVAVWFMNGGQVASVANFGVVGGGWQIVGDDNKGDIFWRDGSGDLALWKVNGSQITAAAGFGTVTPNWVIAGFGDFNGDGVTDILWRDTQSGNVAIWFLNGAMGVQSAVSLGVVSGTWSVAQTADYNDDGISDILWIDGTGNTAVWFMNGSTITSTASYGNVGTWSVQSANAE